MNIFERRFLRVVGLAAASGILASGCGVIPGTSSKLIPPGYVGLKVELYGKNRGIQNATIKRKKSSFFPATFSTTS